MATRPAASCEIDSLPAGLLATILRQLSSTQAQLGAARTCHAWRALCKRLFADNCFAVRAFVTLAAENRVVVLDEQGQTLQSFEPMPPSRPRRRHHGSTRGHWRMCKHLYRWPTCLALGPAPGSLYVSQYRVRGVLRYDTDPSGTVYRYTRVVASDQALESPEGIVANVDGSLFVVSAAYGTVNLISAQGTILRIWSCNAWTRDVGSTGTFRVPWGMCRGPDRALYIAVHTSDGGDYTEPTPRNTGDILRLELDGSEVANTDDSRRPFSIQEFQPRLLCEHEWKVQERPSELGNSVAEAIRQEFEWQRAANPGLGLNRPSNPCFWNPSRSSAHNRGVSKVDNDRHCQQSKVVLMVSSFKRPQRVMTWSSSADEHVTANSGISAEPVRSGDKCPSRYRRGIATFNVCSDSMPPTTGSVPQLGVAVELSAAADVDDWRPWGLSAHGHRVFATGHAGGATRGSGSEATAECELSGRLVVQQDQSQSRSSSPAVGGPSTEQVAEGCVKVWDAGRWRTLRAGLREPNYILVC